MKKNYLIVCHLVFFTTLWSANVFADSFQGTVNISPLEGSYSVSSPPSITISVTDSLPILSGSYAIYTPSCGSKGFPINTGSNPAPMTFTLDTSCGPGTYQINANAQDSSGDSGNTTAIYTIMAPSPVGFQGTVNISPSGGSYSVSSPPSVTISVNDSLPILSGSYAIYTPSCGSKGFPINTGSNPGPMTFTLDTSCGAGTYQINANAQDSGGDSGNTAAFYTITAPVCSADNSCAASTCAGSTCTDSCNNTYSGTKNCVVGFQGAVHISPSGGSYSVSSPPSVTISIPDGLPILSGSYAIYTPSCGSKGFPINTGSNPAPMTFTLDTSCGAGTYQINVNAQDSGGDSGNTTAFYTITAPVCSADNSCAANTCTGSTCNDSCNNTYQGTKNCVVGFQGAVHISSPRGSYSVSSPPSVTISVTDSLPILSGSYAIYTPSCGSKGFPINTGPNPAPMTFTLDTSCGAGTYQINANAQDSGGDSGNTVATYTITAPVCSADNSCAANTCTGSTCTDSCNNIYLGTKNCLAGFHGAVHISPSGGSYSVSSPPSVTISVPDGLPILSGSYAIYTPSCGSKGFPINTGPNPAPMTFTLDTSCGPGTYQINANAQDSGGDSGNTVAIYTVTPPSAGGFQGTINISPSGGSYSVSYPPAVTISVTDSLPILSGSYAIYTPSCGSQGFPITTGSHPAPMIFRLDTSCGAGTYQINVNARDSGGDSGNSTMVYTIVTSATTPPPGSSTVSFTAVVTRHSDSQNIEGALVVLNTPSGNQISQWTDSSGKASFGLLPFGHYPIKVYYQGGESSDAGVDINPPLSDMTYDFSFDAGNLTDEEWATLALQSFAAQVLAGPAVLGSDLVSVTPVPADFSVMKVYPNPWRADQHANLPVTFDHLPLGSTVKIFTVSGHLVNTLIPISDTVPWYLNNDSSDKVASGVYIYLITHQGQKKTGQIFVIK